MINIDRLTCQGQSPWMTGSEVFLGNTQVQSSHKGELETQGLTGGYQPEVEKQDSSTQKFYN